MLGNKCQTLCNQPGACALVGFSMGKIMSKEVKPLTHCVHNPHLQANIIGGKKKKKNMIHKYWQEKKQLCYLTNCASWALTCILAGVVTNSVGLKCQTSSKLHSQLEESVWCTRKTEWERNEISGTTTLSMANSRVLIVKFTTIKSEQQAMSCCVYTNKFWYEWS